MNIYLGPKRNFKKRIFFLNSNKNIDKLRNKVLFDFIIKSSIFLYFEKVILFPLSYFVMEIIDDKINKIKWSYSQNLRKLKYENSEIPNSLHGSLSCVEFCRINQNPMSSNEDNESKSYPELDKSALLVAQVKLSLVFEIWPLWHVSVP